MANYRMVARVPDHRDLEQRLNEQIHAWVRWKRHPADEMEPGTVTDFGDAQAIWLTELAQDQSSFLRFRLREEHGWLTTLTAEVPGGDRSDALLWLDVEGPTGDEFTAVPRLARHVLGCVDGFDGQAHLADKPITVHPDDIDSLVHVLCDPDRRGLSFVAGSRPDLPWDAWHELVAKVLRETVGSASAFILDPTATRHLEQALGPDHAVPGGTIRTYKPGLDPASRVDARRHKILGTRRLAADREIFLARVLGRISSEQQMTLPLPNHLMRLGTRLARMENELLAIPEPTSVKVTASADMVAAAQVQVAATAPDVSATISEPALREAPFLIVLREGLADVLGGPRSINVETVQQLLKLAQTGKAAEAHRPSLERRLDELTDEAEELRRARDELIRDVDDLELELAEEREDKSDQNDLVRALQRRLESLGRADEAWTPVSDSERRRLPSDYEGLLDAIPALAHIRFTGDSDVLLGLQDHDPVGNWAGKTWEALLALDDYGAAKAAGFSGSFHTYLSDPNVRGHKISVQRYKAKESETVNNQWRQERIFRVPPNIEPSGQVFMEAHIAVALKRSTSPRIHFCDATGRDGRVYVGYIGPHLTNTLT